jgi:hypothetical protein
MENHGGMEINYRPIEQARNLSLQEKVLARGMFLKKNNAVSDYSNGNDGVKRINDNFTETDYINLSNEFVKNPRETSLFAINNILSVMGDSRLLESARTDRVKRYTDAYLNLIIKLDHNGCINQIDKVHKGIPKYVPDGLSDMGSDPDLNDLNRNRERIRVDKEKIFKTDKQLLYKIFTKGEFLDAGDVNFQRMAVEKVANYVYENIRYDYNNEMTPFNFGKSLPLSNFSEKKLGVCRHQAMLTQVLLQTLGVDVRLMKCNVGFDNGFKEPHANNLVKIEDNRYLLDVTNPDFIPNTSNRKVYVRKLPEGPINLNNNKYNWNFGDRTYETRNNMYFRIRDNVKTPA